MWMTPFPKKMADVSVTNLTSLAGPAAIAKPLAITE
jgi:hypothetical protein